MADDGSDAASVDDKLTLSYAARRLGYAHLEAGRLDVAGIKFEESVRLRQEFGHRPAAAAATLVLAEREALAGNLGRAEAPIGQARSIAAAVEARGVLGWIERTGAELGSVGKPAGI